VIPLLAYDLSAENVQSDGSNDSQAERLNNCHLLLNRLSRSRWSPDGRYVAFGAARDGPSVDLYIYDIQTDAIQRLSDEPDHIVVFGWSPDSQWIVYAEAVANEASGDCDMRPWPVGYGGTMLRAVSIDSGEQRTLSTFAEHLRLKILGWSSSTELLLGLFDRERVRNRGANR
jgi:Tol biopolymer transport system component